MPLDVQPLSAQRRAAMVFVLLGVLALSLAFAQTLVNRRTSEAKTPVRMNIRNNITFSGPPGFAAPSDFFEQMPNVILSGLGRLAVPSPRLRQFGVFSYPIEQRPTSKALRDECLALFALVLADETTEFPPYTGSLLGNCNALEMASQWTSHGGAGEARFLLQRLAILPEESADPHMLPTARAVAICYSGDGPITDFDKTFFNKLCQECLHISIVQTP